jgi:hypothetical protein
MSTESLTYTQAFTRTGRRIHALSPVSKGRKRVTMCDLPTWRFTDEPYVVDGVASCRHCARVISQ